MITGASAQCRGPRHPEPPARDHIGAAKPAVATGHRVPGRTHAGTLAAPAPAHYVQLPGFPAAWNGLWNELTAEAWALRSLRTHGRDRNRRLTATTSAASRSPGPPDGNLEPRQRWLRKVSSPAWTAGRRLGKLPTRRASADHLQAVAVAPDRPVLLSLRRSSLRGVPQGDPPVRRRNRPWPFDLRAALKIAYGRTGGDRRRG